MFERGTFYHVRWSFPTGIGGGEFYGVYKFDEPGVGPRFWQPAQGRFLGLRHGKKVVEVTALTAPTMLERLSLYDRVYIHKYGGTYTGTVVNKGRTRACVAFRTRGGADKEQWFNALTIAPAA